MPTLTSNSTILFAGDSITDCSRDAAGEVTPWSHTTSLGRGYVSLINGWLFANHPELTIRVINRGRGGRTVRDLKANWETEVLEKPPTWLSIMIGINDVWRQFDVPARKELHVLLPEYRETLEALVAESRPKVEKLILATPYIIEPNRKDSMRSMMDEYGAVVRSLATQYDAVFVDTQAAFDVVLQHRHAMEIAWDRIHSDVLGHSILAKAWLTATGFLTKT